MAWFVNRLLDTLAYGAVKLASKLPRGGFFVAKKIAARRPALRRKIVPTKYGAIVCDLSESACWPLVKYGEYPHWRPDEEALSRIPLGGIVVDIGANIGVTASIFGREATEVHAFEPAPRAIPLLRANAPPNVKIYQVALSNVEGVAWFNERAALDESSLSHAGIEVPVMTLDSFALRPTFIKIDVEGYEHRVLQGASETIKLSPVIMFEAFSETARQYCEDIILAANSQYRFESMGGGTNHIAWPT